MEAIDPVNTESHALAYLLAAKEARRRQLAGLSFPDKVKALVRLQEMAAPVLRQRGRNVKPCRIGSLLDGQ